MRKFTSLMLMLMVFVSTAMADLTQLYYKGTNFWAAAENCPAEVTEVANKCDVYSENGTVQFTSNAITVTADGDVVVTFTHNGGEHMLCILGVDAVNAEGTVVANDYHFGKAGGNHVDNAYTLTGLTANSELTLRCFVYDNNKHSDRTDRAQGNYTVTNVTGEIKTTLKPAVNLANGTYIFRGASTSAVALYNGTDIKRGAFLADATDANHKFTLTKGNNGFYTIQANDGKFVTYSATSGNNITFSSAAEATDDNKWWSIREGNQSAYRTIVPATNDVYNAPGWNYAKGVDGKANSALGFWESTDNGSQWYIFEAGYAVAGNVKLNVANIGVSYNGTNLVKANNENPESTFTVTKGENGYFTIQTNDSKYFTYTGTGNGNNIAIVDAANATDDNKWWVITYDLANTRGLDILPKQNNINANTPALNWSVSLGGIANSGLGFWNANDGNSYCSIVPAAAEGTFMIVNAKPAFNGGKVLTAYARCGWFGTNNNPGWATLDENDPLQYWTLEDAGNGKFYIKAAFEGNYITSISSLGSTPVEAEFVYLGKGQYNINMNDATFHANLHGWGVASSDIIDYDGGVDTPSAWTLLAVNETPEFTHTLSVGDAGYSTLMLGFNATIPDGVEVYTAKVNGNFVDLTAVEDVLPANTAVIVKANKGNYTFNYTAEAAAVESNDLQGTLYNKNIAPAGTAYVLGKVDDKVALYTAILNQLDGTAFLNNANKAYLVVANANPAAQYSFRFGEGTTGIENVESAEAVKAIFDLTGRRVEAVTAPGIYIVNGKKVLVK